MELLHLSVVTDRSTGVPHWWCNYRKRSGGGITEPRRIYPLPLQDDGTVVSWHLLERWKARLIQLPPLQSGNGAADGLGGRYGSRLSASSRCPCRHHNPTRLPLKPADPWLQGTRSRISAT